MKEQWKALTRIAAGLIGLIAAYCLPAQGIWRLAAFLVPYAIVGWDVLYRAARNAVRGQLFDENFLMALATVGAFAIGEYPEGVAVMLFYQVGELFQRHALARSRRSIAELMDIRPDFANLEQGGALARTSPEDVRPGDVIVVKPGERVPLDGVVLTGTASVDASALTGESMPRSVRPGDEVLSGCVNLSGALRLRVEREFGESTVSKILAMVENASEKKARTERFITRFARVYTPAVVLAAALLALLPPLISGGAYGVWIGRALTFLVVSCPCALVISVPLSFFGGIGGASRAGILVKGGNFLEALARADTVVFDKTGTLTKGVFTVVAVHPDQISQERLLELAVLAESFSDHPISTSLKRAHMSALDLRRVSDVREEAGRGVCATVDDLRVCVGNGRLMDEMGVAWRDCHLCGTVVHVAVDGVYAGHIVISDEVKEDAKRAIDELRALGVRRIAMLTGDTREIGERVAAELGLDEAHCDLLPGDKVALVEGLLADSGGGLAFVGDGVNDAPVLARADIGIAMGALGSDAAIEAADVVLMDDGPAKVALAMRIARRTMRIARQNIGFALGVKAAVLLLGALGITGMWEAVFADVGVSVLAILNAMRAMRVDARGKGAQGGAA